MKNADYPQSIINQLAYEETCSQESWINISETICGFEISQLTPRHILILNGINSPVLNGDKIKLEDIVMFLWVCSPNFSYDIRQRNKFIKNASKINYHDALFEIQSLVSKTFIDADYDDRTKKERLNADTLAYIIDTFAREYGWSVETTMQTPLRQVYQLTSVMNERTAKANGETYSKIRESDKMVNKFIRNRLRIDS
jgi:hypothetical protein